MRELRGRCLGAVILSVGLAGPALGHESLSMQDIEVAVERVLQRRDIQRRNFRLCAQLAERITEESMACITEGMQTARCTDGSLGNDLIRVLDRPECTAYSKVHARCWDQWRVSSDPFSSHLFVVCMDDPLGWIRGAE